MCPRITAAVYHTIPQVPLSKRNQGKEGSEAKKSKGKQRPLSMSKRLIKSKPKISLLFHRPRMECGEAALSPRVPSHGKTVSSAMQITTPFNFALSRMTFAIFSFAVIRSTQLPCGWQGQECW